MLFDPPEGSGAPTKRDKISPGCVSVAASNRTIAKREACRTTFKSLIPPMSEGDSLHVVGAAVWDCHDMIDGLQGIIGVCDLYICTWAVSVDGVNRIAEMKRAGRLRRVFALLDPRTTVQKTDACAILHDIAEAVGTIKNHAKVYVLRSLDAGISIVTSANLNRNPHAEAGVIAHDAEIADFHIGWITAGIRGSEPFDPSDIPEEHWNDGARKEKLTKRG